MKKRNVIMLVFSILFISSFTAISSTEKDGVPPLPNPFMITELKEGWNMVGYPNQGSVDLELLSIDYNGTIYTWTEAWEQSIILRFVYDWDRDLQSYYIIDEIEGGYGYWMYTYFDCELWSLNAYGKGIFG